MQPTRNDYLERARENRDFAYTLSKHAQRPVHIRWALISLFYSALHLINAYNAGFGFHTGSHTETRDDLDGHPVLGSIADDYADLLNYSYNARYTMRNYSRQEFENAGELFQRIEKLVVEKC